MSFHFKMLYDNYVKCSKCSKCWSRVQAVVRTAGQQAILARPSGAQDSPGPNDPHRSPLSLAGVTSPAYCHQHIVTISSWHHPISSPQSSSYIAWRLNHGTKQQTLEAYRRKTWPSLKPRVVVYPKNYMELVWTGILSKQAPQKKRHAGRVRFKILIP